MQEIRLLLTAVQYFTRVPMPRWVGHEGTALSGTTRYFPAIGVAVGAVAAAIFWVASLVFFGNGMSQSDRHSHLDLPLIALGGAVTGNRHVRREGLPLANLWMRAAHEFDVPLESFGNATGPLDLAGDTGDPAEQHEARRRGRGLRKGRHRGL